MDVGGVVDSMVDGIRSGLGNQGLGRMDPLVSLSRDSKHARLEGFSLEIERGEECRRLGGRYMRPRG